jgi:hypothetical protein
MKVCSVSHTASPAEIPGVSSENGRAAQTHALTFQLLVLEYSCFLSILHKQDKISHTCTTTCSILKVCSLPMQYVHAFCVLLTISSTNCLVFTIKTQCAFCEVIIKLLITMWINTAAMTLKSVQSLRFRQKGPMVQSRVQLPTHATGFSHFCNVQTGCRHHSAFIQWVSGVPSPAAVWSWLLTYIHYVYSAICLDSVKWAASQHFTFRLTLCFKRFLFITLCCTVLFPWGVTVLVYSMHWKTTNGCKILTGKPHRKISFEKPWNRWNKYRGNLGK